MKSKKIKKRNKEIIDYDELNTTGLIDKTKALKLSDLGLRLPITHPTQVISIRLPSTLLNEIRAIGSQKDVPYQALIKFFLSESVAEFKRKR